MRQFCSHLKRKRVKDLSIELKDPEDYTFKDVLSIAVKINEQHNAPNTGFCMRRIQACCRATANHKPALMNLLNLAPTDVYGCLISGGLTLIIGVSINAEHGNEAANILHTRGSLLMKRSAVQLKKLCQRFHPSLKGFRH